MGAQPFYNIKGNNMSYLVLARKWRPQTWEDVVAQEHVTSTLKNAISHNRLAHAYLFTGPRGVGKTSAARILSKALNCEKGPTVTPCNKCSSCLEITDGRNVDVLEIDGASNRGIDEVRNLRENIKYTPAGGKNRIYIIDEVHMLTNEAFNALLKTLEEPPEHVLFIFATTEPHKVPATIVSRCQRFDFHRISIQEIMSSLKSICQQEKISIDDQALLLIARKADGSLRDSQSILDQMISFAEGKIETTHVIKALGLIELETYFEVTDVLLSNDTAKALKLVDQIVFKGYDIGEFLAGMADHLRNLLIARSMKSTDLIEVSDDHKKRYMDVSAHFQEEDLLRLIRLVSEISASLKRTQHPKLLLETAMVRMIKMDKTVQIQDLLSRLGNSQQTESPAAAGTDSKNLQDQQSSAATGKQNQDAERPKADSAGVDTDSGQKKTELTLQDIQNGWDDFIARVRKKKITVGSFLQEGVLLDVKKEVVQIGFGLSNGFHIDAIERARNLVTDTLKEVYGKKMKFQCVKKDFQDKKKSHVSKEDKMKTLQKISEKEPAIKKILNDFDAEIIE